MSEDGKNRQQEIRTAGRETLIVKESRYKSIFMHLEILPMPLEILEAEGSAHDEEHTVGVGLYRDQAEQLRDWLNEVLPRSSDQPTQAQTENNNGA